MNQTPSSRWLRFSLRGLLIAMTLLCGWLAWETSVVRSRRALKAEIQRAGQMTFTTAGEYAAANGAGKPVARVSLVRRLLGDEAIQSIYFQSGYVDAATEARVAKAFPEAELQIVYPLPCHPGCFPAGTLVDTPSGSRPIETFSVGDEVLTVLPTGETEVAAVQKVFTTPNLLWKVTTADGEFVCTQTQPLCLADGTTKQAGKLERGDRLRRFLNGELRDVEVLEVAETGQTASVFNLILGDSQVFVAGGYLARSKPPAASLGVGQ